MRFESVNGETSAGESGYRAGEHAFARIAAQRYIRAQKTRSKCRRRFTALHHHTRTPRLRFPTHNSKFRQEGKKTELYRLIWKLCSVLIFENRFISCFKNENRINSRLKSTKFCLRFFLSAFEIIGDSACWMSAENSGIQTNGCAFPGKAEWESGDFGMAVVKLKTGNPTLRFTMELSARNASFHCESCF